MRVLYCDFVIYLFLFRILLDQFQLNTYLGWVPRRAQTSIAARVCADSGSKLLLTSVLEEVAAGMTVPLAELIEDRSEEESFFRAVGVRLPRPDIGGSVCPSTVSSTEVAIQIWCR